MAFEHGKKSIEKNDRNGGYQRMSVKPPYGEPDASWDELPLPDGDQSWQAMKALLDKDDDRKPLLPPFLAGCAVAALLGLGLLAVFFWLRPVGNGSDRSMGKASPGASSPMQSPSTGTTKPPSSHRVTGTPVRTGTAVLAEREQRQDAKKNSLTAHQSALQQNTMSARGGSVKSRPGAVSLQATGGRMSTSASSGQVTVSSGSPVNVPAGTPLPGTTADAGRNPRVVLTLAPAPAADSATRVATVTKQEGSSPAQVLPPSTDSAQTKKANDKHRVTFSAGVGLQEQIRSGGQVAYRKSYNGSSAVADHIPSVYVRAEYRKWFLQGEFRFGAPQLVNDFSYSRQTRYDTVSSEVKVTTLQLKKLYYHQVPLSLNYTVLPNWSVGAGAVFSRFYRAVAEQDVESRNVFSGAQSTASSRMLVPGFRDSFLYKTQVQWLVQTDYNLGRLSLGVRYKRDLQPYIRYTKPDGAMMSRRGEALEAVLRWRLWKNR
jgi:hypothetical protein